MNVRCLSCGQVFDDAGPMHQCAALPSGSSHEQRSSVLLPPLVPTYAQAPPPRSTGAYWFAGGALAAVVVVLVLLLTRGDDSGDDATVDSTVPAATTPAPAAPPPTAAPPTAVGPTVAPAVAAPETPTVPTTGAPPQTAPVQTVTVPGNAGSQFPSRTWDGQYAPEPASGPLLIGHQGERVRQVQSDLELQSLLTGTVDGYFGPGTEDAVVQFQRTRGLPVTGIVGQDTLDALANPGD